jgi:hypothetical protein
MHWTSSRGQPTQGGPPTSASREGTNTPHLKKSTYYQSLGLGQRKTKGRRPLVRPRHRWEDIIKLDFNGVRWWDVDWSGSGWGTCDGLLFTRQWTFGFRKTWGISWLPEEVLVSQAGLSSMELVKFLFDVWRDCVVTGITDYVAM